MKKLLTLIVLFAGTYVAFGQHFVLTPKGLVSENDPTKNYVVVQVPNLTKDELFTVAHRYITTSYISPKDVMSVSGTDLIAINGSVRAPYIIWGMANCDCHIRYKINLEFRDERFKVEFHIVDMDVNVNSTILPLDFIQNPNYGLYKKGGTLTKGGSMAKPYIENVPNNLIDKIKNWKENPSAGDDW